MEAFEDLGRMLLSAPVPWASSGHAFGGWSLGHVALESIDEAQSFDLSIDAMFAMFCLVAFYIETMRKPTTFVDALKKRRRDIFIPMLPLFAGRLGTIQEGAIEFAIESCGFSDEQGALVLKWIRRDIDFVGKTAGKSKRVAAGK